MNYRMAVDASICFSVEAASEEEARAKANAVAAAVCDGVDISVDDAVVFEGECLNAGDADLDMRAYIAEPFVISVENIES